MPPGGQVTLAGVPAHCASAGSDTPRSSVASNEAAGAPIGARPSDCDTISDCRITCFARLASRAVSPVPEANAGWLLPAERDKAEAGEVFRER